MSTINLRTKQMKQVNRRLFSTCIWALAVISTGRCLADQAVDYSMLPLEQLYVRANDEQPQAQVYLSSFYFKQKDAARAYAWALRAEENGDSTARNALDSRLTMKQKKEADKHLLTFSTEKRFKEIVIPSLGFNEANLNDILLFITMAISKADESKQGVNFLIIEGPANANQSGITLSLKNTPAFECFQKVLAQTDYNFCIEGNVVWIEVADKSELRKLGQKTATGLISDDATAQQLKTIQVNSCAFRSASLTESLAYLEKQFTKEEGIQLLPGSGTRSNTKNITFTARDMSLFETLDYIAQISGHTFTIEKNLVQFAP